MNFAYKEDRSWFHNIDPITKFLWALIVAIWLISLRDLASVVSISLALLAVAIIGAKIPVLEYIRVVVPLLSGGGFLILFQGLFRPGKGMYIWVFHLSYMGMLLGAALDLRVIGVAATSFAFSRTTKPKDVATALVKVGVPYKIAYIGYLSLRFLPLFEADLKTV